MAKEKKEKWRCYDCGASNSKKNEWCTSDLHDMGEEIIHLKYQLRKAEEALEEEKGKKFNATYMTLDQFVSDLSSALRDHLKASFRDDGQQLYHPEDLISNASTFVDAAYHVSYVFRARV